MKELLLHVDKVSYEVTKPTKMAEKISESMKKGEMKDCLFVRIAVEKSDEKNPESIVSKAVEDIIKVCNQIKTKNVMIYPYVHLLFGSKPGSVETALKILKKMEKYLKEKGYTISRAPFGFYKKFTVSCKGHPLAELSREISSEGKKGEEVSEAVKKEEKELKSEWYVMGTDGKLNKVKIERGKVKGFDFSKHRNLEKFALYEMAKSRAAKEEPPHVKLMRRLELVDYEPGSDPGNFRYMPAGKLVKSLLEEWVTGKVVEYGAMEVETPIMYDYEHPSLKSYLNRFPARQYTIETPNKRVFLRFAACFGQFLMSHDANISYRNLPYRIYEMSRYSFRVEQRGELAGLRRLRAFTMPDCHAFCRDVEEAKKELMVRLDLSKKVLEGAGVPIKKDLEIGVRIVKDFYEKNRDFVKNFVKKIGKPVLVEMWDKQFFYFVFKYESNFVDALDKAAALSTDQIDVENAERYGIEYTDRDNKKKHPIILHLSPSGAIERVIYALLEKAYMEQKGGKNPVLPLWLSPTQVRLCPVNESFKGYCDELADKMDNENIRVDIDDRVESVGKKIRDSEVSWVPHTVVVGQKEKESGKLPVRYRETGKVREMSLEDLVKEIQSKTKGFPFRRLSLSRYLTKRPIFIG